MNAMNMYSANAGITFTYNVVDFQDLCRVCGNASNNLNSLFDDHGCAYDFSSKINVYLPIKVHKTDYLPLKICSPCANTLLTFHQLYIVCQTTNSRFQAMLEAEGYEQQLQKQTDGSELLELQSSISREIENEILYMNESKDIINEIESEIAANAAVKELERIGSSENISLVGEAIDQFEDLESTEKRNAEYSEPKNKVQNENQSQSDVPVKSSKRTSKNRNEIQKSNKARVLNENGKITSKSLKKEKISPKKSKEETANISKDLPTTSENLNCEFCNEQYSSKSKLVEHIKDVHTDLIFHCEMCDDYVARENLISHMLNHALNANTCAASIVASTESQAKNNKSKTEAVDFKGSSVNNNASQNHDSSSKENHLPKEKRSTYCAECDKHFADKGGLRYHIDHFHKKIKNYECDICGTFFSCKRIISNHIRGVHIKERKYECGMCGKKFSTDSALYIHKKSHDNVLKFECQVCERRFRSRCKLKIHMTMHTKEKNFFCEICNRGFAIRNNLTKHLHTHSKSYDFKCDKCNYRANQKRYLFEHIKRTHKSEAKNIKKENV